MKSVLLSSLFQVLGWFARYFLSRHKPFVIGVTGSVGKTSARMVMSEVLSVLLPKHRVETSSKNFNGELGMSLSILQIQSFTPSFMGAIRAILKGFGKAFFGSKPYEIIILEYGIDHLGEMDFLLSIAKPDIAVLTKIDSVHSLNFSNKEIIAEEKYKLLLHAKRCAFLNLDDEFSHIYVEKLSVHHHFFSTRSETQGSEIHFENDSLKLNHDHVEMEFDVVIATKKIHFTTNYIPQESKAYIGIGCMIGRKLQGELPPSIQMGFSLQPSRFGIFRGKGDSILIDSSYNAAPESMKAVIDNVIKLQKELFCDYRLMFCLGEMRELGEYTAGAHKELAVMLEAYSDVFVVGESMKKYFLPFHKDAQYYRDSRLLGAKICDVLTEASGKYLVLFKGSQNTIFMEESVIMCLKDPKDVQKICRGEGYWKQKKQKFFDFSQKSL